MLEVEEYICNHLMEYNIAVSKRKILMTGSCIRFPHYSNIEIDILDQTMNFRKYNQQEQIYIYSGIYASPEFLEFIKLKLC